MKHRKIFTAVIVTILVASVSFAIACSKEKKNKQFSLVQQENEPTTKSSLTWNNLITALCAFNQACNDAYLTDSVALIAACNSNDTIQFYELTGLSLTVVKNLYQINQTLVEAFLEENPTYEITLEPCSQCTQEYGLPLLGYALTLTTGHLPASIDDYTFPMDDTDCWMYCGRTTYDYLQHDACVSACLTFLWNNQHSYPYN